ncbi:hypothetical protein [Qipengyuania atrilutea]|uniref:Uncharacterized protein n=1 Tax=Qipengyuania atrilutea TaxID=2744473 RepID=A0A850H4Y8_9SPHN|nr:hypothetical protein [Actirhodobacter atriluteus]NVD45726.1 hypothetical protein [Actirhodobacter atriluteus]
MAYEQKPDSGSLFKNDRREKDTHPHAKGSALIGGVEYWVDAWTNEDRNGNKYQALKFKQKDAQGDRYQSAQNDRQQASERANDWPEEDPPF